jgi:tripartite-type tricarboxylate transporter receptor subunit TctC
VVSPKLQVRTVANLVAYAKGRPEPLPYGISGVGSMGQLVGEMLQRSAGIELSHVSYRGAAPAIQDMLGG